MIKAVGKNLAPHLKSMSAVWYIGQSDPHAPAAQAALSAWKSAFPPQKLAGAVEFCQQEILSLIVENLTTATSQTLSDPKITTPEDMEAKYVRTVSMSLISYANLLDTVKQPTADKHTGLIDHAKFWKLAKHKDCNIRKAFYTAVTQMLIKLADSLALVGKKVVPAVLGSLGDLDAGEAVWCCGLQLLSTLPSPWEFVSPHKAVFPAVWKLMGVAGAESGLTLRIYPYLMPFLSKIPFSVMEDCAKFLSRWFASMLEGLEVFKARNSISGCRTVIVALLECMFYLCNNKELELSLRSKLLSEHLIQALTVCPKSTMLFESLSIYLLFWNKSAESDQAVATLNRLFWSELKFVGAQEDPDYYVDFIISLGRALRTKQEENAKEKGESCKHVPELINTLRSIWKESLDSATEPSKSTKSLESLYKILTDFGEITALVGLETDQARVEFYNNRIVPLLTRTEVEDTLTRLTWALAENMSEPEGLKILDMFVGSTQPDVIPKLVNAARRSPRNSLFQAWLGCASVQGMVVTMANNLVDSLVQGQTQNTENWQAINSILGAGLPVPEPTQRQLFLVFQEGLSSVKTKENRPSSVRLIEFICDLISMLTISHEDVLAQDTGTELVKLLFSLQNLGFAEATRSKLESCWLSAVRKQPKLTQTLAAQISISISKGMALEDLEKIVNQAKALVKTITGSNKEALIDIIEKMLPLEEVGAQNLSEKAWYRIVFDHSQFYPSITDSFQSSFIQQSEVEPANLILPNQTYLFLSALCEGFGVELATSDNERTVIDEERLCLPDAFLKSSR